MSAPRSRSPSRSTTAPHPDADTNDVVHGHVELLTSIDAHLAALVQLTSKQHLGSPHLSIAEAAVYLGISVDNLRRRMRAGNIPHHKRPGCRPYLLRNEIDAWLSDPGTCCPVRAEAEGLKECTDDNETVKKLLAKAKPPKLRADRG